MRAADPATTAKDDDDDESVLSEASDMSASKRNLFKKGAASARKSLQSIFGRKHKGEHAFTTMDDDIEIEPAPIEASSSNLLPPMDDDGVDNDDDEDMMVTPTVGTSSVDDSLATVEPVPAVVPDEKPAPVEVVETEKAPEVEEETPVVEEAPIETISEAGPRSGPAGQSSASLVGLQFLSEDDIIEPTPSPAKPETVYEDEPDEEEEAATKKTNDCFLGCVIA
mmetsp:Transcript_4947/g.7233  ORF Transcript_4947/g.7233 Transcript_4947/m.7233 type:complete len:224 (-) Transcript_4947:323-994(-)|eukprot:CAMPEP_0116014116 /NCGR_PEP_ID=MMETSP0321-20121206/6102_1 /TAXON_ID=163516 /ORGANISM="Leptocylindrus danicus var. danicus, Strain B650" /LENGTH=223 /DNA_ID=CAMNT_0003483739 /DNA_START=218 /DNA_END=889 /DNA_ORIENTATION=-